ncbi:hypothetical protein C2E23DRAFT_884015 [Lenzites betulinus]|nr:hypothetical protein C2E23DRAFT_884015 [Lenzites betulinus]
MSYYMPYYTGLRLDQANAIRGVLETCTPCNIMCMRVPPDGSHIRYQHVHRVYDMVVCISMQKTRRSSQRVPEYYVFTTDTITRRSEGLTVPVGHYPISAYEWYSLFYPRTVGTSNDAMPVSDGRVPEISEFPLVTEGDAAIEPVVEVETREMEIQEMGTQEVATQEVVTQGYVADPE